MTGIAIERQLEVYQRLSCVDCSVNTLDNDEYYMVHDDLWNSAGMDGDGGMLCIGCLEARLGRELTSADFMDAPCNSDGWSAQSPRLRDRIARNGGVR